MASGIFQLQSSSKLHWLLDHLRPILKRVKWQNTSKGCGPGSPGRWPSPANVGSELQSYSSLDSRMIGAAACTTIHRRLWANVIQGNASHGINNDLGNPMQPSQEKGHHEEL